MNVCLVTPAPPRSHNGNRVTALRWAGILRGLGHAVEVTEAYDGCAADLLVALHARRSAASVARFRAERPQARLVLALTGTDVYRDLDDSAQARRSVELADRLVVLQPLAAGRLPAPLRDRVRVIYQSVPSIPPVAPAADGFQVAVLAHLRRVKDPFRAAEAVRLLPAASAVRVVHLGAPLEGGMAGRARAETDANPRYRWLGEAPREEALRVLAASRLLVLTSELEGGANVVSEALAAGVPVLSSRIDGSVGLLGPDYPGYFPVGDAAALARLLRRAETDDGGLYGELAARCAARAELVDPARERAAWAALLDELA